MVFSDPWAEKTRQEKEKDYCVILFFPPMYLPLFILPPLSLAFWWDAKNTEEIKVRSELYFEGIEEERRRRKGPSKDDLDLISNGICLSLFWCVLLPASFGTFSPFFFTKERWIHLNEFAVHPTRVKQPDFLGIFSLNKLPLFFFFSLSLSS